MKFQPIFALTLTLLFSTFAQAATITVTSAADDTNVDGQVTLREALLAARTDTSVDGSAAGSGADTIVFDASLQGSTLSILLGDASSTLGPSAFYVTDIVTIDGEDKGITLVRDPSAGDIRFFAVAAGASLTLRYLTLVDGISRGEAGGDGTFGGGGGGSAGLGGALLVDQGSLSIHGCVFRNNQAWGGQGGNVLAGSSGNPGKGGSLYSGSGGAAGIVPGSVSTPPGNGLFSGGGGGAAQQNPSIGANPGGTGGFGGGGGGAGTTLTSSGGLPQGGAGGYGAGAGGTGHFSPNRVGGGGGGLGAGGAVFARNAILSITSSSFYNNLARGGAGGTGTTGANAGGGGNGEGGAIFVLADSALSATAHIVNNNLLSNTAVNSGGTVPQAGGALRIKGSGSALPILISNNLIYNNSGNGDLNADGAAYQLDGQKNLISAYVSTQAPTAGASFVVATQDPLLSGYLDFGGGTLSAEPAANSPLHAAGDSSVQPATDQRGVPRLGANTIGAFQASGEKISLSVVPNSIAAGVGIATVVTISDRYDRRSYTYTGTVSTVSSDAAATLPTHTFTLADKGQIPFSLFTLRTAGVQSVTYRDLTVVGMSTSTSNVQVVGATSTQLSFTNLPRFGESITLTATVGVTAPGLGVPQGSITFLVDGGPVGASVTLVNGQASLTLPTLNAANYVLKAQYTPSDASFMGSSSSDQNLTILQAIPAITWAPLAPVGFGATLSAAQLNATANVPGTFVYTPALGTALPVGTQSLSVTFTPTDGVNYTSASAQNSVVVAAALSPAVSSSPQAMQHQYSGINTGYVNLPFFFSVGANDPQNLPLTYVWDFGDGTSGQGEAPSHTYTTVGTFLVTLTIKNNVSSPVQKSFHVQVLGPVGDADDDGFSDEIEGALGSGSGTPGGLPRPVLVGAPTFGKATVSLNFAKVGRDAVAISATLPVTPGFNPAGKTVIVNVGGVVKLLALDAKGKAKGASETLAIKAPSKKDPLQVALSFAAKGDFAALLGDEGLSNATLSKVDRSVPVTIIVQDKLYQGAVPLLYSAKQDKTGKGSKKK